MRTISYTSRVLVKYCTKEILCAHRLIKIRGNIGPILFVLYTADAENNKCRPTSPTWPTPLLLHKRCTALLLHFRVNDVNDSSSIHPSLSFYWCRRLLNYSRGGDLGGLGGTFPQKNLRWGTAHAL